MISYLGTMCYQKYCLERADLLLFIVPIFFILLFLVHKDFIKLKNKEEKKKFHKKNRVLRILILISRTLMILGILAALALPFTTEEVKNHGKPVIKLLVDNTESMNVYDSTILENVKKTLENSKIPVEIRQISSGKRSELGEGILKNIEGNDNLLIVTDGNNNFGKNLVDVGIYAGISNTNLFALDLKPVKNDAYVEIIGPSETIEGTLNKFTVKVNYVGAQPSFTLDIYVDDKNVFSGQNVFEKEIEKTLSSGYHKVTAKITLTDFFPQNNMYEKTVKAVQKPKILYLAKGQSQLQNGLKDIYELTPVPTLPVNLKIYSAIIIDDIPYSELNSRIDDLTGYLLDGGGIVFVGGRSSFDKGGYKDTLLEALLPVQMGSGKVIEPLKHNIVIALDISGSFADNSFKAQGEKATLDLGKGMAAKMIEGFRDDINVGLVAFTELGKIISEPVELKDNREKLIYNLESLPKIKGAGTVIEQGLFMSEQALQGVRGTKNVILISDGKEPGRRGENPAVTRRVQKMTAEGIKIYTVGLPSYEKNRADIDRDFMNRVAVMGNGNYFEPSEFQFLNVFFGKPEAKEKIFSGSSNLAIIDKNHFITKDLKLNAKVTGINFVIPKSSARSLIFTGDGNPVLVAWNFGIGRVVTLATDNGGEWSASLLTKENSMLLTRMINYAVGNPERDKEIYIETKDGYLGEDTLILVKSNKYPVSKELTFVKQGETTYKAAFNPEKEGVYKFFDSLVAINQPREYYRLGFNSAVHEMVELSGGKILDPKDENLVKEIQSLTERTETVRKDLKLYPLAFVLLIFILEILIRKIYEYKRYQVNLT